MAQPSATEIARAILEMAVTHSSNDLATKVSAYIVESRRTSDLGTIMREVERLRQLLHNITEVTITTAVTATPAILSEVKRILGNNELVINQVIDKSVIGGVRIESSNYYLDLTVRNRLNKMKIGA